MSVIQIVLERFGETARRAHLRRRYLTERANFDTASVGTFLEVAFRHGAEAQERRVLRSQEVEIHRNWLHDR